MTYDMAPHQDSDLTPCELLGLYENHTNIDILYKGRILGICSVILYVDNRIVDKVQYEIADNLSLFGANHRFHNLHPIMENGEFTISSYYKAGTKEIDAAKLVEELLAMLQERYACITLQLYQQEIIHGRH